MSSGMNRAQAEEYAKTMTYRQAVSNIKNCRGIKYRKATMIKLHELADIADTLVLCNECIANNDGNLCVVAAYINEDGNGFCNCGERRKS